MVLRLFLLLLFLLPAFCACGYSGEEKARMEKIQSLGRENAVNYVIEKYGFTPEVYDVELCMVLGEGEPLPWANGNVLVSMGRGEETFTVRISGEETTLEGADDLQHALICQEAKEYFQELLGYEFQDFYLGYWEEPPCGFASKSREAWLIHPFYPSGNIEDFFQQYPVRIRIDDCIGQDFDQCWEGNPKATVFFQDYGENWGMKTLLISYRSSEDYQRAGTHRYNEGGPIAFDIGNDGLYIRSYAVFSKEEQTVSRFVLQEYEGVIVSCTDPGEGREPAISADQREWMDLGETKGRPCSKVYSVSQDTPGDITVYLPEGAFPEKGAKAFIQHYYENQWRQYEVNLDRTRDKQYKIFTYHGYGSGNGDFDFTLFP